MQLGLYFLFYRVMYCLLSIVVFNVPILLLTPFPSDRCFIFKIFFSPPLIVERVKLYHPKVRVMSRYGGQRRDLILEPVSGPISASLEGASIVLLTRQDKKVLLSVSTDCKVLDVFCVFSFWINLYFHVCFFGDSKMTTGKMISSDKTKNLIVASHARKRDFYSHENW